MNHFLHHLVTESLNIAASLLINFKYQGITEMNALSSDVLAHVCSFLRRDRNVVDLFICCKKIRISQFLAKVDLKTTYHQDNVNQYKTLYELRKRIRSWKVVKSEGTHDMPHICISCGLQMI
jgi:hypothetical protein